MATSANRALPNVDSYTRLALQSFTRILLILPKEERLFAGGTFSLTDEHGVPYFGFQVGDPPLEKRQGRWARSFEKSLRAAHGHCKTSRATRQPVLDRWGGSLWGNFSMYRGSFSGFPEDYDEIFVADVMVAARDMSAAEAKRQLGPNKTFKKFKHDFVWAR